MPSVPDETARLAGSRVSNNAYEAMSKAMEPEDFVRFGGVDDMVSFAGIEAGGKTQSFLGCTIAKTIGAPLIKPENR
ncbi:hypothetical protein MMC07_009673 [Pseudocyphellaria aurata]|nr:hypothetical protein [Pseudocyphellaria aurata]